MSSKKNNVHKHTQNNAGATKNIPATLNKKLILRLALIIGIFSFLIYANTLHHGYVLDDESVIKANVQTQGGVSSLKAIFTSDYRAGFPNANSNLYRPLSKAMFAIEWQLSPNNPTLNHFINILVYAILCSLLFVILLRLTKLNVYVVFITALLFAAHPIHTEVVANIKSRDEILSMLFILLSIQALLNYVRDKNNRSFIGYLFCFLMALLSKESAMVYIGLVPLLLYFFTGTEAKNNIRLTLSAAAIGVFFLFLHYKIIGSIGLSNIPVIDNSLLVTKSFFEQKATAILILGKYLLLLIFPHPLSSDYSFDTIPLVTSFANAGFLLALLVHVGLLIYAFLKLKEKQIFSFCIFFYLISMSIASNIFMLIGTHMAERLLFLPSLAFCLAAVYGLCKLLKIDASDPNLKWSVFLNHAKPLIGIAAVVLVFYSAKTVIRNKDWAANSTLFAKDLETVPNSAHMLMYSADYLSNTDTLKLFSPEEQQVRLLKAQKYINKALSIYNLFPDAHYLSGRIWYQFKNYQEALKSYSAAMALNPGLESYHNNVGTCLFALGRYEEAAKEFAKAAELNPNDADPPFNTGSAYGSMGEAYRSKGDMENANKMFLIAIDNFKKAIRLNPNYKSAYQFLGTTYNSIGDTANGQIYLEKASQIPAKK
ncbi:MAG: repeat-containing protein YrrB [Bacteroidetes bacterium]|nr:repeat-containing protein YrrB [Bacteroidota bacterium]